MQKLLGACALALALSQQALAADEKFYVFGMVGSAKASDLGKDSADASLRAAGATNLTSSVNDTASAFAVGGGFRLAPQVAIEAAYLKTNDYKYNAQFTQGTADATASVSGIGLSIVGYLPVAESVDLFGKLGLWRFTVDTSATVRANGVATASQSGSGTSPSFGAGIDIKLNPSIAIRAEYDYFSKVGDDATVGTSNVNMLSAGLVFKF